MADQIEILVEPSNYFNINFLPLMRKFQARLLKLGLDATIKYESTNPAARKILFGAHSKPENWHYLVKSDDIIVNLEPIYNDGWRAANKNYLTLLNRCRVFDYDTENCAILGANSMYMPVPPLSAASGKSESDSVLFVGAITPYRERAINLFHQKEIKIETGFDVFGEDLIKEIQRHRFFLSLVKEDISKFSTFRFALCSATSTLYFGETGDYSNHPEIETLVGRCLFADYKNAVEEFKGFTGDSQKFSSLLVLQNALAEYYENEFNALVDGHVV